MLIRDQITLAMFPRITFGLIGCSLDRTAEALSSISAAHSGKSRLTLGDSTLDEILEIDQAGTVTMRHFANSYVAIMYTLPGCGNAVVISSLPDGWITLCNSIAVQAKTYMYNFALSDEADPDARNAMEFRDCSSKVTIERVVYAMKDPRWIFYESGDRLWFEEPENYTKRLIKNRMNRAILIRYCEMLNLKVRDPNFFNDLGRTLKFELSW